MKKYHLFVFFFFIYTISFSQEIKVSVENVTLNTLLIDIRDNYNIDISFDDTELAKYTISLKKSFKSPEKTFDYILKDLPINYEKINDVYLFFYKTQNISRAIKYTLSGVITDAFNSESLPYTNIIVNGFGIISDEFGNFNFVSTSDSIFKLRISYLGYRQIDTIISPGVNHKIKMTPANLNIEEVVVTADSTFGADQTGSKAGLLRLNQKVAFLVPGNGDNSIFNILRLQPGILAAGEQSSELLIWGSYAGQNQINFDGITLFGLKNFNDNISAVNPYLAKDIRIYKGGFDATFGERVGGIIDITGIDGNKNKTSLNANISNTTMNLLGEIPIGKKLSIIAAYRQTYYNLYSDSDFQINNNSQTHFLESGILVSPDYGFRDGNLKISGNTNSGDTYQLSSFWGQDKFSYDVEQEHQSSLITQKLNESNTQYGFHTRYNKLWKGKGSTEININYSFLQKETRDTQSSTEMGMNHNMHNLNEQYLNSVSELKAILKGDFNLWQFHKIKIGTGLISNETIVRETSFDVQNKNELDKTSQIIIYIQDKIFVHDKLKVTLGVRADYSLNLKKSYLQPRLNLQFRPITNLQFNASWGIYNQFISQSTVVDQYGNYRYLWIVSDDIEIPVLNAQHLVVGSKFKTNGFSINVEGFYKITDGITRQLDEFEANFYEGQNKTKGIDFLMKQELRGHSFWISYTLSESLERFSYFQDNIYRSAIHDQRHEIKFASIINLAPFHISVNYVYGSGFLQNTELLSEKENYPYKRLDISGTYKFSLNRIKFETGLSILNLFNYDNIKLSDITQIPDSQGSSVSIYSETVPFTPTLFLNLSF
ncbi:MAG: carboxypeptidase-like regulatory domain-containing protein [Salinivirgaceae bacterium]